MKRNRQVVFTLFAVSSLAGISLLAAKRPHADTPDAGAQAAQAIISEIMNHGHAYADLESLVAGGARVSGSPEAARAVDWAKAKMESYGFDRVWLQPVTVPAWVRGDHEAATIIGENPVSLHVAALGTSVGTGPAGVEADVIEVHGLDDVNALGDRVRGKIVFYNRPMDPTLDNTFNAYGGAVDQRNSGPSLAARYGAVAVLVRSMTTLNDLHPHTGATHFVAGVRPIPAAAIATQDADTLDRALQNPGPLRVKLELSARNLPSVQSYNVIGEITGRELPDEFVVVGGHLDSWDLGRGAQDDGAGVVQTLEILRAFKTLGLRPRRTVRAVLFMCEEFGGIGAAEYRKQAELHGEKHVAAMESDRGGFLPLGISYQSGSSRVRDRLQEWSKYLAEIQADRIMEDGAETDVAPLTDQGVPALGLMPESKHYFDYHHSALDQLAAVDARELHLGAAAMGVIVYLTAEYGF